MDIYFTSVPYGSGEVLCSEIEVFMVLFHFFLLCSVWELNKYLNIYAECHPNALKHIMGLPH